MTIIVQKETLKAAARFELTISCLLDRRFNQLSHGAMVLPLPEMSVLPKPFEPNAHQEMEF